jgi:hypothetical protein
MIDQQLLDAAAFIDDDLWCFHMAKELALDGLTLEAPAGASHIRVRLGVGGITDPLLDPRLPRLLIAARQYRRCHGVAVHATDGTWRLSLADGETIAMLPGLGQRAVVEAAFDDILTVAGTGDTVVEDFLGNFIPLPDGGFEFVYGPLVTAMREGRALLIDDATLIAPKVLAVLYPAMDGRRVITIPGYRNERVEAADGFYVIAGHNPGVHGAILTEALASRFDVHIEVTTDWDLARYLGVPAAAVNAAVALNTDLAAGRLTWAPQLRELLGFARVRKSLGLPAAVANLAGRAPDDDRPDVIAALAKEFGADIAPLTLGKQR